VVRREARSVVSTRLRREAREDLAAGAAALDRYRPVHLAVAGAVASCLALVITEHVDALLETERAARIASEPWLDWAGHTFWSTAWIFLLTLPAVVVARTQLANEAAQPLRVVLLRHWPADVLGTFFAWALWRTAVPGSAGALVMLTWLAVGLIASRPLALALSISERRCRAPIAIDRNDRVRLAAAAWLSIAPTLLALCARSMPLRWIALAVAVPAVLAGLGTVPRFWARDRWVARLRDDADPDHTLAPLGANEVPPLRAADVGGELAIYPRRAAGYRDAAHELAPIARVRLG
jgi:hypothetical protein